MTGAIRPVDLCRAITELAGAASSSFAGIWVMSPNHRSRAL
jgi:hypothetical protein